MRKIRASGKQTYSYILAVSAMDGSIEAITTTYDYLHYSDIPWTNENVWKNNI